MFGLEDRHLDYVLSVLKRNISDVDAKFYIFGSRAKGTSKKYSDIDIAVDLNGKKLDVSILGKILIEFQDSTLPFEVDVVDLNSVDEDFRNLIKKDLVLLQ